MTAINCRIDTYRADNVARITCPIFGAEVEIRQCIALRDRQYRGEQVLVRRGCQACISASKCPVSTLMQVMEEKYDNYFSAEPKLIRFAGDVLKRIAAIIVPDHILKRYGDMSESQRNAILATNGIAGIEKLKGDIQLESVQAHKPTRAPAPKPKSVPAAAPVVQDAAALVNTMMEGK